MGDERIGRARVCSDRILDVEKLDVALAVRGQPLPADAGCEVDHAAGLRVLDDPVRVRRAWGGSGRLHASEHLAHRHAELGHERPERADGRVDAVELDLRHETRRDADSARELAEADAALLSLLPEPSADQGGLEITRDGHGALP